MPAIMRPIVQHQIVLFPHAQDGWTAHMSASIHIHGNPNVMEKLVEAGAQPGHQTSVRITS